MRINTRKPSCLMKKIIVCNMKTPTYKSKLLSCTNIIHFNMTFSKFNFPELQLLYLKELLLLIKV